MKAVSWHKKLITHSTTITDRETRFISHACNVTLQLIIDILHSLRGHFRGGLHSQSLDWYWQTKQYRKINSKLKTQNTTQNSKQCEIQQKTIQVQSSLAILDQEARRAYSTKLPTLPTDSASKHIRTHEALLDDYADHFQYDALNMWQNLQKCRNSKVDIFHNNYQRY